MDKIRSIFDLNKDAVFGTVVVLDSNEAQINAGKLFEANVFRTDIQFGTSYYIHSTTPSDKFMHLYKPDLWQHNINAQVRAFIFEGVTATATGGTAMVAYNKNRNSSDLTSGVSIMKSATVNVSGLLPIEWDVHNGYCGTVSKLKGDKLILKQDTKYCIRLSNITTSTATADVNLKMLFSLETEDIG